jgi:ribonuclease HI
MLDFKKVEVVHIPREKNKEADRLANKAMDERLF